MNSMTSFLRRIGASMLPLAFLILLGGCASATLFVPARYTVDPDRAHKVEAAKTVVLCTAFDRLPSENRKQLDPTVNPSAYLTDVLEKELTAAGVTFERASFAFAPGFDGLHSALAGGVLTGGNKVVLASAVNFLPNSSYLSCDFKLYASDARVLFEKRGLCINLSALPRQPRGLMLSGFRTAQGRWMWRRIGLWRREW